MKILIADDAPLIRDRFAALVRGVDGVSEVLESADIDSTLASIRRDQPDVVVLDWFMPGGTGIDVLRSVAHSAVCPRVIVLTGRATEMLRKCCMEAGAEYFFEKGSEFLRAVKAVEAIAAGKATRLGGDVDMRVSDMRNSKQPPRAARSVQGGAKTQGAAGLRILVAEDHDFQRSTMVRLLRTLDVAEVLEASDGIEALAVLKDRPGEVDLILCDLDMPNMDGMEFMRHLSSSGSSAPVIITSAQESTVMNSVQIMAKAYGVRLLGIMEKPAKVQRLRELIAQIGASQMQMGTQSAGEQPAFSVREILQGIERNEFEAFFQPKADMASGRIVGAEALARWRHRQKGLIAPAAFIDPLERAGCIDELTFAMIRSAVNACRGWEQRGFDVAVSVSVNLSLVSLTDTRLADRVTGIAREAGLAPQRLVLEITESAAMTKVAPALENLSRLRMRGFGLSIDDYGTGFASMQQLGRVPFSELKVDRGFVADMADKREARAMVESSVEMARRLGMKSVAEGVETKLQWDMLKAIGCDLAQGYLISKPVDAQQFIECLAGTAQ